MNAKSFIVLSISLLLTGCGVKDVTNTIAMTVAKESANDLKLDDYGYKNGKYLGLDIGHLHLKQARSHHKIEADDVVVFMNRPPKNCKLIGYITIENPKGLKDISAHYGLGHFDFESYANKYLKKAASLYGVKWLSGYTDHAMSQKVEMLPDRKHPKYYVNDMGGFVWLWDAKTHKVLRISARAYECENNI